MIQPTLPTHTPKTIVSIKFLKSTKNLYLASLDNYKNLAHFIKEFPYIEFQAVRVETFMFENIPVDKIGFSNKRQSNLEYLGSDMIEGGNEFGAGTPYGKISFWL